MNKNIFIFFIAILLYGLIHAQTNLVPNSSFETGPGEPACFSKNPCCHDLEKNIDYWADAEYGSAVHPPENCAAIKKWFPDKQKLTRHDCKYRR